MDKKKLTFRIISVVIILVMVILIVYVASNKNNTETNQNANNQDISSNTPSVSESNVINNSTETTEPTSTPEENVEETVEIEVTTNNGLAEQYNVDYSKIEKLLDNESLNNYFNPIATYSIEVKEDENGKFLEKHYRMTDTITTGKFRDLFIDLTYASTDETPDILNMRLICSYNYQEYTNLLANMEISLVNIYGEELSGKLCLGNVAETLTIGNTNYIVSQTTTNDADNNFILNYYINKETIKKNYTDINEYDFNEYNIYSTVPNINKTCVNSDDFKNKIMESLNIVKDEEVNYSLNNVYHSDTLDMTRTNIDLTVNKNNVSIESAVYKEDTVLNEYCITVEVSNKKNIEDTARNIARTLCNVETISDEFIYDKESKTSTLDNYLVTITINNKTIKVYNKNFEVKLNEAKKAQEQMEQTEPEVYYDDYGNEIEIIKESETSNSISNEE